MMATSNWIPSAGEPRVTAGFLAGGNIIDAEFETVTRGAPLKSTPSLPDTLSAAGPDHLSLLREEGTGMPATTHPNQLTPSFMFFTLIAAFVVFWVSGGHVLLY